MVLVERKDNIFNDNIAYVSRYDFSTANASDDNRILAVTTVASICYNTEDKAIGKRALYDRLHSESKGLPSSSFEFIPMLFKYELLEESIVHDSSGLYDITDTNMLKFGRKLVVDNIEYLLTNYRAVVYDYENLNIDYRNVYNDSLGEQQIIRDNYTAFLMYVDMPTRSQVIRHRQNAQERSRRYVSNKKNPFQFYISDDMSTVTSRCNVVSSEGHTQAIDVTMQSAIDICLSLYNKALESGIKMEDARRIIPQAAYTTLWMGFEKVALDSFFNLRCDYHTQPETRKLAEAMKSMMG